MSTGWLVETHYLRMFLQLSRIPHYTTLQKKLAARINGTILAKIIIAPFIILTGTRLIFAGIDSIDSTGFKLTHTCIRIILY
jgi:ABC-type glucose/galactose transport system permease subunit